MSKNTNQTPETTDTQAPTATQTVELVALTSAELLHGKSFRDYMEACKHEWDAAQPPKTPKSVLPKKVAEKSAEEQTKYVEDTLAKLQARLAELTAFRNATMS
jgi:hypothetical protein